MRLEFQYTLGILALGLCVYKFDSKNECHHQSKHRSLFSYSIEYK